MDVLPALARLLEYRAAAPDTNVVVENVEPAPTLDRRRHHPRAVLFARDVGDVGDDLTHGAGSCCETRRLLSCVAVSVRGENTRAGLRQQNCRGAAVPDASVLAAGAGHNRDFSSQAEIERFTHVERRGSPRSEQPDPRWLILRFRGSGAESWSQSSRGCKRLKMPPLWRY